MMAQYDFRFCSAFGYPLRVQRQLTQIVNRVLERVCSVESILVVGSTARGELSYIDTEDDLRLFSDYELVLLTQREVNCKKRYSLALEVDQLGRCLNPGNPLFHVDLAWYPLHRLPRLRHTVAIFEQKKTGKVVWGKDYRHLMPEITIQSLSKKDVNEILYKRLWALLLYLPQEFFKSSLTSEIKDVATYVLVRNALDLTTVLLPYAGVLLPTYAQRVEYLADNYGRLELERVFGPKFPRFLAACLEGRDILSWEGSLFVLYAQVVGYLEHTLRYLLARQGQAVDDVSRAIQAYSPLIFREWLPRRAEIKHALRVLRGRLSLQQAIRWPGLSHKGLLTACLIQIHRSMIAHLSGNRPEAHAALQLAQSLLDPLISRPLSRLNFDGPFIRSWLALRRDCGYFWWEFVRRGGPVSCQRIRALTDYV